MGLRIYGGPEEVNLFNKMDIFIFLFNKMNIFIFLFNKMGDLFI